MVKASRSSSFFILRFVGRGGGAIVEGHVTPEAYVGGAIALANNGDPITIDAEKRELTLGISANGPLASLADVP
jgi:dihydroxy-acid dehydratase